MEDKIVNGTHKNDSNVKKFHKNISNKVENTTCVDQEQLKEEIIHFKKSYDLAVRNYARLDNEKKKY